MVANTVDNEGKIKQMVKENSHMVMGMSMKVNGLTIKQMDMVFICMQMVQNMKAHGLMINKMDLEKKCGQMERIMRESIKMGRSKGKER